MAAKAMKREAVTSAAPTAKRAKAEDVDEATEVERLRTLVTSLKEELKKLKASSGAQGAAAADAEAEPLTTDEGDKYFELSSKRRVTISQFRGRTLVAIREYYEKEGKQLPGKGISLTVEQYQKFASLVPAINKVVERK